MDQYTVISAWYLVPCIVHSSGIRFCVLNGNQLVPRSTSIGRLELAKSQKKGPKPLRLVLVREHEGEHRSRIVAGANVEFQVFVGVTDDDGKEERVRTAALVEGDLRHRADVMEDALEVVPVLVDGILDGGPY